MQPQYKENFKQYFINLIGVHNTVVFLLSLILIAGLSAIQGGPMFDLLDQLLQSPESEQKVQFLRGLEKTGLIQVHL